MGSLFIMKFSDQDPKVNLMFLAKIQWHYDRSSTHRVHSYCTLFISHSSELILIPHTKANENGGISIREDKFRAVSQSMLQNAMHNN